jgi:NhaA family Na+:H+ antiporter
MSLFIAGLALKDGMLEAAKIGILAGSVVCALTGTLLLRWLLSRTTAGPQVLGQTDSENRM